MSKVSIEGNANGTGNFTIAAPNSNTDRTLTLPDEAGEVVVTDGTTLAVDNTNDRVGIGTSSPAEPLHVIGTIRSNTSSTGNFNFYATSTGGGAYRIYPDDATTANPTWLYQSNSSEDQAWVIGGVERMRLNSSGIVTKPNQPSFAGNLGGSNLTTGTTVTLFPVSTYHNIGNHFDSSAGNYKFTCPVDGVYLFSCTTLAQPGSGATNWARVYLQKNGSSWLDALGDQGTYGAYQRISFSVIVEASANDYFQFSGHGNSTTNFFYTGYTNVGGYLIG